MRSSWQVTRSVWRALFMREVQMRATANRFAWLWMLVEPVVWVVVWLGIRNFLGRFHVVVGADFVPWLLVGILGFFLFREGVQRSLGALEANQGLFAYRQVQPVDTVLIRNVVEGFLKTIVFVIVIMGASLLGYDVLPANPLRAVFAWASLWLFGTGVGLVVSVGATLVPEIRIVVRLAMLPMLLLSGVIFSINVLPHSAQQYLLYNPILHGVEFLRLAFFPGYATANSISALYLWYWILASLALGLALHMRFANRLRAK